MAVLYLLTGLLFFIFADKEEGWNHVSKSVLSRYMPEQQYLLDLNQGRTSFNARKMKEFEIYYRKVSEWIPDVSEAYAMAGLCYYYRGDFQQALTAYEQAARINPKVFNFYFNSGLIEQQLHHEAKALDYFKKSVAVPVISNLQFIVNSPVYKPFLPKTKIADHLAEEMEQHIRDVYRRSYLEILTLLESQKDYQEMMKYARYALSGGFLDQGTDYYYLGLASYGLRDYENAANFFQEAARKGFHYSQAFEMLGLSLKALGHKESVSAMIAAESLKRDGKIFKIETSNQLIIY